VVSADYRELLASNEKTLLSHMDISDEAYKAYSDGMYLVAHDYWGTASGTFYNYPIKVAAKTGTAQHGITGASDHGAFVCYAPLDDPRIAIAIYVEKGGHGSTIASIAKAMLDVYFEVGEIGDVNIYENQLS
jgi:penicillin-binding protein 2